MTMDPMGGPPALPSSDERTVSMLAHVLGLVAGFIPPLIVMLTKGNDSPWVRTQSVEALNFQITLMIAYTIAAILVILLIGLLLLPVIWIASVVLMIIAGMKANAGELYRYPFNIRLVK